MTPPNWLGKEFITALISHFSGPRLGETEPFLGQGAWLPLCFPLPWGLLEGLACGHCWLGSEHQGRSWGWLYLAWAG